MVLRHIGMPLNPGAAVSFNTPSPGNCSLSTAFSRRFWMMTLFSARRESRPGF
jgi:hypothetical protein